MKKLTPEYLYKGFLQRVTKPTKDVYHICMGDREGFIRVDFRKETIQLLKSYMIVSPAPEGFTEDTLKVYLDHFTPPLPTPLTYRHVVANYAELMVPSPEGEDRYLKLVMGCTYVYIDLEKGVIAVSRRGHSIHRTEATEEALERLAAKAAEAPSDKKNASKQFAESMNYTVIQSRHNRDFNILLEDVTIRVLYGECIEVLDLENKLLYERPPKEGWLVEVLNFHTPRVLLREEVMRMYSDKLHNRGDDLIQLKITNIKNYSYNCLISIDFSNTAKGIEVLGVGVGKIYPLDAPFTEQSLRVLIQNLEKGRDASFLDWNAEGMVHPDKVKLLYPTIEHKILGDTMNTLEGRKGHKLVFTLHGRELEVRIWPKNEYRKIEYTKKATMADFKKWLVKYSLLEVSQGKTIYPLPEEEEDLIEDDEQDLIEGSVSKDEELTKDLNLTEEYLVNAYPEFEKVKHWDRRYELYGGIHKDVVVRVDFFSKTILSYAALEGKVGIRKTGKPFTESSLEKVVKAAKEQFKQHMLELGVHPKTTVKKEDMPTTPLTEEYLVANYPKFVKNISHTARKENWHRWSEGIKRIDVDFDSKQISFRYWGGAVKMYLAKPFTAEALANAVRLAGHGAGTQLTPEWVTGNYAILIKDKCESTYYLDNENVVVDFASRQIHKDGVACEHFDRESLIKLLPPEDKKEMVQPTIVEDKQRKKRKKKKKEEAETSTPLTKEWIEETYSVKVPNGVDRWCSIGENIVLYFDKGKLYKGAGRSLKFDCETLLSLAPVEGALEKAIYAAPLTEANLNKYYPQLVGEEGFYEYPTGDRVRVQVNIGRADVSYAMYDLEKCWINSSFTLGGVERALEYADSCIGRENGLTLECEYTLKEFFPMQVIKAGDSKYRVFKDPKNSICIDTRTKEVYDTNGVIDVFFTVGGLKKALDTIKEPAKRKGGITQERLQSMELHESIHGSSREIFRVVGGWLYIQHHQHTTTSTFVPERVSNVVVRVGRDEEE